MVECIHKVPDLVVMRHCKSAYPLGVADHDRPLNARGERDARAAAQWFTRERIGVDQAWVSSAVRAQQTWTGITSAFPTLEPRTIPELYEASTQTIMSLLTGCEANRLLVIAHNPGLERLIARFTTSDPHGWLQSIEQKYPTGAICILRLRSWPSLGPEGAELIDYAVPRATAASA